MDDHTDPPPGVSITAVEIDFWNLVAFAIKAVAAVALALLLIGIPVAVIIGAYLLAAN